MQSGLDVEIGDFDLSQHLLELPFPFFRAPPKRRGLGIPGCEVFRQLAYQSYGAILRDKML